MKKGGVVVVVVVVLSNESRGFQNESVADMASSCLRPSPDMHR